MAEPRLAPAFPAAAELGDLLLERDLTVAVAESCTGGLLGAVLTASPGSTRYLRGGVIAYSNDVKKGLLEVPSEVIDLCGAVSDEVARAMAGGVRRACGADLGIAITGVAGPGESASKPAGLIHLAVAGPGEAVATATLHGDRGREANRARAVRVALDLCLDALG